MADVLKPTAPTPSMADAVTQGLKPCPFCGSAANVIESGERFYVACDSLDCFCAFGEIWDRDAMADHQFATRDEAIAAWNTRASTPSPERGEDLREALNECADKLWIARCDSKDPAFREAAERACDMASAVIRAMPLPVATEGEAVNGLEPKAGHADGCGAHDDYACDCTPPAHASESVRERARELLAAEYERAGRTGSAEIIRGGDTVVVNDEHAIRAISAALQPLSDVREVTDSEIAIASKQMRAVLDEGYDDGFAFCSGLEAIGIRTVDDPQLTLGGSAK